MPLGLKAFQAAEPAGFSGSSELVTNRNDEMNRIESDLRTRSWCIGVSVSGKPLTSRGAYAALPDGQELGVALLEAVAVRL